MIGGSNLANDLHYAAVRWLPLRTAYELVLVVCDGICGVGSCSDGMCSVVVVMAAAVVVGALAVMVVTVMMTFRRKCRISTASSCRGR